MNKFIRQNFSRASSFKVARHNTSVAKPSIFESLVLKQIDFYVKIIITRVLQID